VPEEEQNEYLNAVLQQLMENARDEKGATTARYRLMIAHLSRPEDEQTVY